MFDVFKCILGTYISWLPNTIRASKSNKLFKRCKMAFKNDLDEFSVA